MRSIDMPRLATDGRPSLHASIDGNFTPLVEKGNDMRLCGD
jgi:hypothetical protein